MIKRHTKVVSISQSFSVKFHLLYNIFVCIWNSIFPYVLRYAVLKPMGVVFLGHKVVYESKSILPSISRCFPSVFASFWNVLTFKKMAWVLQAIWYTIINGRSNISSQLLKYECNFCFLVSWKKKISYPQKYYPQMI